MKIVITALSFILLLADNALMQVQPQEEKIIGSIRQTQTDSIDFVMKSGEWIRQTQETMKSGYDPQGRLIEHTIFSSPGPVKHSYVYRYDEQGALTEKVHRDNSNKTEKYSYDYTNNKLTAIIIVKADGSASPYKTYKYDAGGRRIEENYYEHGEPVIKEFFKYFDKSVVEQLVCDGSGRLVRKNIETYNAQGLPVERKQYNSGNDYRGRTTYSYNEKGQLIESAFYDEDEVLSWKETLIYGDKNEITRITAQENGGLLYQKEYSYEFDLNGNWTKKICTWIDKNNQHTHREEARRTITYRQD